MSQMEPSPSKEDTWWVRFFKRSSVLLVLSFLWISSFVLKILNWNDDCKIRRRLPPIKSDILNKSATELRERLRTKQITCLEIIETFVARIQEVDPILKSVVQDRFEDALKEAKQVDSIIRAAENLDELFTMKPLLGLPVTIKENIAVRGLKHSSARTRVQVEVAKEDAHVVNAIRYAGAIPLLVSNSPELCKRIETVSKNGRTRNPYDTTKSTGGSSGGEASLLGSGASIIGIGSDIAGSVRVPAMFCGVYGHKPTPGYISVEGHNPSSPDPLLSYYLTIGPMVRFADDLPLVFNSLLPKESLKTLRLNEPVNISDVKIYYMAGEGPSSYTQNPPSKRVCSALRKAVNSLKNIHKCTCEEVQLPYLVDSVMYFRKLMQLKKFENVYQRSEDPDDWSLLSMVFHILRRMTMFNRADFGALLWGPLRYIERLCATTTNNATQLASFEPKNKFTNLLGDNAVFLYPTFSVEAQPHNDLNKYALDISYTLPFNVFGVPATQCPIKIEGGLPVGIQVIAAPSQDRLCFAVAKALQTTCAGWTTPDF